MSNHHLRSGKKYPQVELKSVDTQEEDASSGSTATVVPGRAQSTPNPERPSFLSSLEITPFNPDTSLREWVQESDKKKTPSIASSKVSTGIKSKISRQIQFEASQSLLELEQRHAKEKLRLEEEKLQREREYADEEFQRQMERIKLRMQHSLGELEDDEVDGNEDIADLLDLSDDDNYPEKDNKNEEVDNRSGEKNGPSKRNNPDGGKNPDEGRPHRNHQNTNNGSGGDKKGTPPTKENSDGDVTKDEAKLGDGSEDAVPQEDKFDKFLAAMTTALSKMAPAAASSTTEKFIVRQSHAKDLPNFNGASEEWPSWKSAFDRSTATCGFSDDENLLRLQKCLKGDALKTVQCMLVSPSNVPEVIHHLEKRFGAPKHIVESLIERARTVPMVKEEKLESIIEMGTAVKNLTATAKSLNCHGHLSNPQLVTELVRKLSPNLKLSWMEWLEGGDGSRTEDLLHLDKWLTKKADHACLLAPPKPKDTKQSEEKKPRQSKDAKIFTATEDSTRGQQCSFCEKEGHGPGNCYAFKNATLQDRWKKVKDMKLCFGCLRKGHPSSKCNKAKVCEIDGCPFKHHRLLHKPKEEHNYESRESSQHVGHSASDSKREAVLLRILPVIVKGPNCEMKIYALCDEGSTVTLLDEKIASKLGLEGKKEKLCLKFLGDSSMEMKESKNVEVKISSVRGISQTYSMNNVRTVHGLQLHSQSADVKALQKRYRHLRGLQLPEMKDVKPLLLIGSDNTRLISPRKLVESSEGPTASKCLLGWTLGGRTCGTGRLATGMVHHVCENNDRELHQLVKSSFSTESFGVKIINNSNHSREDQRALKLMEATTKRISTDENHRFETSLLWRNENAVLPESYDMALLRLRCTERRMDKDVEFAKQYRKKIEEYLEKGYVRKLSNEEVKATSGRLWYLPHFGVTNPNKPGKVRFVFDAKSKSHGVSLNDFLVSGPDLTQSLPAVLWRFRESRIGFVGDIRDMFHQVIIRREDQDCQRFLWRDTRRTGDPDVYVMERMTFGSTCSPCSATYVLRRNAEEFKNKYPDVYNDVVMAHYIDDYLGGADNVEEAKKKIADMVKIHKSGGFDIVNWGCSSRDVLEWMPEEIRSNATKVITADKELPLERALGLMWNSEEDTFSFRLPFFKVDPAVVDGSRNPTKRDMLKMIMSVFDPLGFLAPFTIRGKILLQQVWRSQIDWDQEIPEENEDFWKKWIMDLSEASTFAISRWYSDGIKTTDELQLHMFCDASEQAFSCVAYFRWIHDGEMKTSFITGKARVAPLKTLSVPRLELQGAVMGTRLADVIRREHRVRISRTVYWSDSFTVLKWLRSDCNRYKQFVAHRVGEILESTNPDEWRWVPSKQNPADAATRDNSRCDFSQDSIWISGPEFLRGPESEWPVEKKLERNSDDSEEEVVLTMSVPDSFMPDPRRFSNYLRYWRTVGWMVRFIRNLQLRCQGKKTRVGELTAEELTAAEILWMRAAQKESFPEEYANLQNSTAINKSSRIYKLSPDMCNHELLRLRGRLKNLPDYYGIRRFPVILDNKHPATKLLVKHYHDKSGHVGRERVINELRENYWVLDIRAAVKHAWASCQFCKITRARVQPPQMGQLPAERLEVGIRAFVNTGLDYFGPMDVIVGRSHHKRYGALFTCLATRAVHVEIAHSLTTDSCLMAIRRFIARRGEPDNIFSDNGTNFVGAEREMIQSLEQLDINKIVGELSVKKIQWHFIPPISPHMGGTWERLVRSIKSALYFTLKERSPKDEVLLTLMAEAENIVNSRPLTYVSGDHEDPRSITPNDFLIGPRGAARTPGEFHDHDLCMRKQWRVAERLSDHFWKRWIHEYIPTLHQRQKWHAATEPVKIGDIVVMTDSNSPRNSWPLGRIVATIPGKDGVIRVVDVKIADKIYRRPVVKIIRLDVRISEAKGQKSEGEHE